MGDLLIVCYYLVYSIDLHLILYYICKTKETLIIHLKHTIMKAIRLITTTITILGAIYIITMVAIAIVEQLQRVPGVVYNY